MKPAFPLLCFAMGVSSLLGQQTAPHMRHEDTEIWSPEPPIVTPGAEAGAPPSDAIVLFDGHDLDQWVKTSDRSQASGWEVADGIATVSKKAGNMETKKLFKDYQIHLEYRIPTNIEGTGQARGNSGLFLASTGKGDAGYELQILDCYNNKTYVNGQAGAVYKQFAPLVNVCRKPGEWQTYDVVWTAPRWSADGKLESPARVIAFQNGVLIQKDVTLQGETLFIGKPTYDRPYDRAPIKLQAHGDKSIPISFRNIWVRDLSPAASN